MASESEDRLESEASELNAMAILGQLETPEEIALAVVSEIKRMFGTGSGESLRERKLPIHAALERADRSALSKR